MCLQPGPQIIPIIIKASWQSGQKWGCQAKNVCPDKVGPGVVGGSAGGELRPGQQAFRVSSCPDKLRENLKACRKIRTNLGKSGGLRPDKSVQPLDTDRP
jgi:hypothetical protein